MNQKTQELISSLSNDERSKLKKYVQEGIQKDLDAEVLVSGKVTPDIQSKINLLTNEYLSKHYQDDLNHIVNTTKDNMLLEVDDLIDNSILKFTPASIEAEEQSTLDISDTNVDGKSQQNNSFKEDGVSNQNAIYVLGENETFEDKHDNFNHLWGIQRLFYNFISKFDDYVAYNILLINAWIGGIFASISLWSIFTNQSAKRSSIELFRQKQDIYISGLLQNCQNTKFKTIELFQQCVTSQQNQIVSYHNNEILFYSIGAFIGIIWLCLFWFLKSNYMGQQYYRELSLELSEGS